MENIIEVKNNDELTAKENMEFHEVLYNIPTKQGIFRWHEYRA